MKVTTPTALVLLGGASLALLSGSPASADTVTLNNGREIHGRLVEEGKKVILIKTGSGVITIPKFKVATFSENENWGNYSKPRSVKELKAIEEANRKAAAKGAKKDPKKGKPKKGGETSGEDEGEWTWDEEVSKATIEELTPIRDDLLKKLEGLGPTAEERLEVLALSREEAPDLKEKIRLLGWKRGRGRRGGIAGSQVYRNKAKKEIVENYGVRAIPSLVKTVGSENLYQARWAAQTLQEIHAKAKSKDDSLWLMNHHEVPTALVELMNNAGDTTSPFVRREANAAMEAIVGKSMGWPSDAKTPGATQVETAALKKWRRWGARNKLAFSKGEKEREANRKLYTEQLEMVRVGKNPEEESSDEE
jgi:hypothetical protein